MRDTADTHDRARIVNNATLTRRNRCVARTIAAANAAASPSTRVISLMHHTMLMSCVVRETVERQSRKVVRDVEIYRRPTDITRLRCCDRLDTRSRYATRGRDGA